MVIMALDHTREFFHAGAMRFSPEDLTQTTPALFFTRWITHFCAPVFVFTAGLGAWFWRREGRSPADQTRYLVLRGLGLMVAELTLFRFVAFFLAPGPVLLTVLWAIGLSMVFLAGLIHLPLRLVAGISVAAILLHNLADGVRLAGAWQMLHQLGAFPVAGLIVVSVYPLVPWFAVMAAGYCCGPVATQPERIERWGWGLTAGFVLLRLVNLYGDPVPWDGSVLSFFRTTKYPPSLAFLLMTLGPALVVMSRFARRPWSPAHPLLIFGRTPLFYFLVHFLLLHLLTFPLGWLRYGRVDFLWAPAPSMGGSAAAYPTGYGYELPAVYAIWALVVLLMLPLCRWYSQRPAAVIYSSPDAPASSLASPRNPADRPAQ
jgi:uncharacterized membrane protein